MKKVFLIILLLAIPLVCSAQEEDQPLQLIIDKKEYGRGEEIKVELSFDGVIYEWGEYGWSVQQWEKDAWKDVFIERGCHSLPKCKNTDSDEIEECLSYLQCERPIWYKIEKGGVGDWRTKWTWNQTKGLEITYQCREVKYERFGGKRELVFGEIIEGKCMSFEFIPAGKYKIRFEYALNINQDNMLQKDGIDIKYVEKEIIIK